MGFMDGLAGWLRQIVAVVLLASLVDLLLPNKTMQRYVRLVAGLFVLLTVATPILHGIKSDLGLKLASDLESVDSTADYASTQLSQIEADGDKLRARQDNQAADLAAAELSASIRSAVAAGEHREVRKVDVKTSRGAGGAWTVDSVAIALEPPKDAASARDDPNPIADVQPVAPVDIDITVEPSASPSSSDSGEAAEPASGNPPASEADRAEQLRIAAFVSARFGIPADAISVTIGTPES